MFFFLKGRGNPCIQNTNEKIILIIIISLNLILYNFFKNECHHKVSNSFHPCIQNTNEIIIIIIINLNLILL